MARMVRMDWLSGASENHALGRHLAKRFEDPMDSLPVCGAGAWGYQFGRAQSHRLHQKVVRKRETRPYDLRIVSQDRFEKLFQESETEGPHREL